MNASNHQRHSDRHAEQRQHDRRRGSASTLMVFEPGVHYAMVQSSLRCGLGCEPVSSSWRSSWAYCSLRRSKLHRRAPGASHIAAASPGAYRRAAARSRKPTTPPEASAFARPRARSPTSRATQRRNARGRKRTKTAPAVCSSAFARTKRARTSGPSLRRKAPSLGPLQSRQHHRHPRCPVLSTPSPTATTSVVGVTRDSSRRL